MEPKEKKKCSNCELPATNRLNDKFYCDGCRKNELAKETNKCCSNFVKDIHDDGTVFCYNCKQDVSSPKKPLWQQDFFDSLNKKYPKIKDEELFPECPDCKSSICLCNFSSSKKPEWEEEVMGSFVDKWDKYYGETYGDDVFMNGKDRKIMYELLKELLSRQREEIEEAWNEVYKVSVHPSNGEHYIKIRPEQFKKFDYIITLLKNK